jgi:hypothetical protein
MKTIAQQQNISPGKYYIILGTNLEYNDETYTEWGEKLYNRTFYKTLEEAKSQKLNFFLDNYGWQEFNTVDQWTYNSKIEESAFIAAFLGENNANSIYDCSETLENFVSFLKSLNIEDSKILDLLPDYSNIYEIELS